MIVQSFNGTCFQWKDMDLCVFNDYETTKNVRKLFDTSNPETKEAFQKVRYRLIFFFF